MKKLIALIMVFSLLFAFASCKDSREEPQNTPEVVTDSAVETVTNNSGEVVTMTANSTEVSVSAGETTTGATTVVTESTAALSDPSTWTDEEIVAFYKNAAINSKSKKSIQKMTLEEMVVNDGDGVLGNFIEWITPIFIKALEDNSTEFDGITGGYEKLVLSDTTSVKAYKSGEYTVVEMTMKEQTDGIHGDPFSGTVGHAISVVGDISSVQEALPKLDVDFENADIKLRYTNPTLKVKINKDGIIEKGTWSYDVDVTVKNLRIEFITVESGYGTVGYLITTGGGF